MAEPMDPRPRGLLVTRNFPPLVGGMERLNRHVLAELAQGWRMGLCGPAGAERVVDDVDVLTAPVRPLWRSLAGLGLHAWRWARRQRPAFVLAGSGLAAPLAWFAARASGARAGVYLHGLDVIVNDRAYRALWWPLIRRCDFALCNSRNTAHLAITRGFPADRIDVLEPGVSLPGAQVAAADYRGQHALGDRAVVVSVGRLTARKGLPEFIEQGWPALRTRLPDAVMLIVGGEPTDALAPGRGGVAERINAAIRKVGGEGSIRALGRCDDDTLRAVLAAADVQVFPVLDLPGDVEGFGMVAVEAAAAGVPTVGFAVGGVPEAIADGVSGSIVAAGDYSGLVNALVDWVERRRAEPDGVAAACREHAARHAWPRFGERLRAIVRRRTMGP